MLVLLINVNFSAQSLVILHGKLFSQVQAFLFSMSGLLWPKNDSKGKGVFTIKNEHDVLRIVL